MCLAKSIRVDGEQLQIMQPSGTQMQLPMRTVQAIENENGRVRFLAWIEPTKQEYAPYANFTGAPRVGMKRLDEVTAGWTGVSECNPDPADVFGGLQKPVSGQLHMRYACGNVGRYTDMSLKILVAGKVVHEGGVG